MKSIKNWIISLALLLVVPHFTLTQDWVTIIQEKAPLVAQIIIKNNFGAIISSGTGFVLETDGTLITNAHVVRSARFNTNNSIEVEFEFGANADQVFNAEIIEYNISLDLASLKINARFNSSFDLYNGEPIPLMSPIVVAGYPLGQSFKSTPGFIQAIQQVDEMGQMLDLSASVVPGNSGGPVINQDGLVVGIVTANIPGYNFNLALPSQNLYDFINSDEQFFGLTLVSDPSGARVFMNGSYKGITPLDLEILNRNYTIVIEKDGYSTVQLNEGPWIDDSNEISVSLIGDNPNPLITIISNPPDATVFINNREVGQTPLVFESLPGRKLRIRVEKSGFLSHYEEITVGTDSEQEFTINLD
jgi:hypothetical protein